MNSVKLSVYIVFLFSALIASSVITAKPRSAVAIAIHGGAGTILKSNMTPELEKAYHEKLEAALKKGYQLLQQGKSSTEAVQAAIVIMEDSELFNAGKGSVFAHDKSNQMDASIMEGKNLNAGAVTGVSHVKNPIKLAAKIMHNSNHVMLSAKGAEAFARTQQLEMVSKDYFFTQRRWKQLHRLLNTNSQQSSLSEDIDDKHVAIQPPAIQSPLSNWPDDDKFGTVGAVALDQKGNLAAATSTGGMTNKKYGRIGDSPIIGAGTYADNQSCAISATGHGEYFIRAAVAHDICARALYKKIPLQQAADEVIMQKLVEMNADGGIVGLSPTGTPVFSFNSKGMYRGYIDTNGKIFTAIFK